MRYTPTLKLSTRLVAFVTMIVTSAIFILFVGGTLSFQRMGEEYLHHYLQGVVDVVDQELEHPDAHNVMPRWLPKLLKASNIVEMQLSSSTGVVYQFKDTASRVEDYKLFKTDMPLTLNQGYVLHFKAVPPYIGYTYSFGVMWSITFAVILIIVCLIKGVKWLKEQLSGSELLEERGRMILAGRVEQFARGVPKEWPYTASKALDQLIEELQYARQERSRFDTFIRSQTFLDQLTGAANRVLFDSKLESTLSENGAMGGVMMITIEGLDAVREESGAGIANELIVQVGECVMNTIQRYPDVMLSRYYDSSFAILIPHQNSREISNVAIQSLKAIDRLIPPDILEKENWCHIGMSMYVEGDSRARIIDEAETAVKSAQLQNMNTWSRFNKDVRLDDERGNVRWRSLFERTLTSDALHLFQQEAYLLDPSGHLYPIHHELFVRIAEPGKGMLKASRFSSAIETVGYEAILDRAVIRRALQLSKAYDVNTAYSINLYVTPFASKEHTKWFRDQLIQTPPRLRKLLSFEFSEGHLVLHLDYMRPVIRMISAFGCKIVVGQVGRTIVSTHYVKDLKIDFLKLHRSLIKRIEQRHENQLFIRSIIGVCNGTGTKVIAVGVESQSDWDILKGLGVDGVQGRLFDSENQVMLVQENHSIVKLGKRNRWKKR